MAYVIGVLSRFPDLLVSFLSSVRASGERGLVCVADDQLPASLELSAWAPVRRIPSERPFLFSRNANDVLEACPDDDVFLCNDDVQILTGGSPVAFLAESAGGDGVGIVSPAVRGACAAAQVDEGSASVRDIGDEWLFFSAIYFPRRTIRSVGMLDEERFLNYGGQDVEFTERCRAAGLRNIVDGRMVVEHPHGGSSFDRLTASEQQEIVERADHPPRRRVPRLGGARH